MIVLIDGEVSGGGGGGGGGGGLVGNVETGIMESSLVFLCWFFSIFILLYKYILIFSGVRHLPISTM